jgi:mRNA interferase RelE/StbE
MRTLVPTRAVLKDLLELPPKQYRQVVSAVFDLLADPCPHYSKALAGTPYRRIAIGEYRVVYRFDEASVHVVAFGKRNDDEIYKLLHRKR